MPETIAHPEQKETFSLPPEHYFKNSLARAKSELEKWYPARQAKTANAGNPPEQQQRDVNFTIDCLLSFLASAYKQLQLMDQPEREKHNPEYQNFLIGAINFARGHGRDDFRDKLDLLIVGKSPIDFESL